MVGMRSTFVFLSFAAPLLAQDVGYELRIRNVAEHLAEVTATFPTAGQEALEVFLPVWSPGFYMRQDHAARVVEFAARSEDGPLAVEHPMANRWRIATHGAASVHATYTLRCERASVTENQIAADFAVFCGPATFVGEVGKGARRHTVHVSLPDGWDGIACGLPGGGADATFLARDYDWLLDSPIAMGKLATTTFDVLGSRHEWTQFGDVGEFDAAALLPKLAGIATEVCRTFGDVPFERYVFLAGFRRANGGLEHLDSTLVTMHRGQRGDGAGTLSFLAHEYAHAFNVKRLRPVGLGPFDYENPPTTPSLWISEGLTTWYGDLALVRSGAIDDDAWLALVSGHIRSLQGAAGRRHQTLADASSSVWSNSTSGVGGDPRTTISYYVKGPVVGFLLEARLRVASAGKHGLDEVMRRAYASYSREHGFTPEQFEAIAAEVAGSDQREFFDRALRSTDELDYREALDWFGLAFREAAADAPREQRWVLEVRADAGAEAREHLGTLLAATVAPAVGVRHGR